RPPLLHAQTGAVEAFTLVQRYAGSKSEVDQVAFAWIVLLVHVATQPLPGTHQSGHLEARCTADACLVVGTDQAPLRFVFHAAVPGGLALLAPLPAQAGPGIVQALDIGMLVQHAHTILIAAGRGRQMHVEECALAILVDSGAGFYPDGLPKDHILAVQAFDANAMVAVHAQRRSHAPGRRL